MQRKDFSIGVPFILSCLSLGLEDEVEAGSKSRGYANHDNCCAHA